MQRAERDLVRARQAAAWRPSRGGALRRRYQRAAGAEHPYHLAGGLLDHAGYLTRLGGTRAAAAAIGEARDIAGNLRCKPLLDRAADTTSATIPGRG